MGQLAKVYVTEGPAQISREMAQRRIVIECNVTGRDIGSFVAERKQKIDEAVKLPTRLLDHLGRPIRKSAAGDEPISIVVPITIASIFLLLFSSFNSVKQAALIILNIPFALIGGILALVVGHFNLSVSASVGFIALFGVAVLNGIVMVSYFNELRREGINVELAVVKGRRAAAASGAHHRQRRRARPYSHAFRYRAWQRNSKATRRGCYRRPDQLDAPYALHPADAL